MGQKRLDRMMNLEIIKKWQLQQIARAEIDKTVLDIC